MPCLLYTSEMFSYFRVPKILFRDIRFKDLSTDAKILYGIMLDRMSPVSYTHLGLWVLAFRWRVRLRVALPGILLAAAVGIGLGNALSLSLIHI